jgi:hypothetical protein
VRRLGGAAIGRTATSTKVNVTKTGDWNSRPIKLAAVVHCYKALHGAFQAQLTCGLTPTFGTQMLGQVSPLKY